MDRRLLAGAIGGMAGMAAGLPLAAHLIGVLGALGAIAVAGWLRSVKSSEEIHRPIVLFPPDTKEGVSRRPKS
jgi:hypothetical protein